MNRSNSTHDSLSLSASFWQHAAFRGIITEVSQLEIVMRRLALFVMTSISWLVLSSQPAHAWNALGHRVIAALRILFPFLTAKSSASVINRAMLRSRGMVGMSR